MNTKETDYRIDSLGAKCSLLDRTFNVPRIVTEIITEYEYLFSVSFLQNDQKWVYRKDNKIRLYNIQGELMESFQIERLPKGIAVTSSGELVYTDDTLNIMNKTYLNSDVGLKLADCIHCSVCNTFYGDLLVVNQKLCVMIMGYWRYNAFNTVTNISIYQVVALNRWVRNKILDICVSDY